VELTGYSEQYRFLETYLPGFLADLGTDIPDAPQIGGA
jgi:hypothetical protein